MIKIYFYISFLINQSSYFWKKINFNWIKFFQLDFRDPHSICKDFYSQRHPDICFQNLSTGAWTPTSPFLERGFCNWRWTEPNCGSSHCRGLPITSCWREGRWCSPLRFCWWFVQLQQPCSSEQRSRSSCSSYYPWRGIGLLGCLL